jgi:peptide/nickel transport system permease protein
MENKNTNNKSSGALSTLKRIAKYSGLRLISLFITVIIGAFLTIMIANMGGYVDEIIKSQVDERLSMQIASDPNFQKMSVEKRKVYMNNKRELEYKRLGLDQPFMIKTFKFLYSAMTLNLGSSNYIKSDTGSKQVKLIIAERLGPSIMLMGTANLILFVLAILIALALSRKYGSKIDKLFISLSPLSSMPAWFYGIFFILLFAAVFKILPFGGMIDSPPPQGFMDRTISILKHLILPVSSLVVSALFASIYSWRTFFMIYSSEDYVEMAKAKGLPRKLIKRRYILRPTLPTIVTSFTLMMITMWMGAMVTETIFKWPGLGTVILQATNFYDTKIIVGTTIIYGYLLAITVFLLDFVYALVDPRVKIGQGNRG